MRLYHFIDEATRQNVVAYRGYKILKLGSGEEKVVDYFHPMEFMIYMDIDPISFHPLSTEELEVIKVKSRFKYNFRTGSSFFRGVPPIKPFPISKGVSKK